MDIKKIGAFSIGSIGAAVLGLLTVPIIAWLFSPEDVGKMSLIVVIASFCNLIFNLGLDQAYVREYYESDNKPLLLKMTFFPGFFILIICLFVVFLFSKSFVQFLFKTNDVWLFYLISIYVLAVFVNRYVSLILRMQGRGLSYSFNQLIPKFILLVLLSIYYFFLSFIEFNLLVMANLLAILFTTMLYVWKTKNDWRLAFLSSFDKGKLVSMLKFGAPLIISSISFWGMISIDRIFLRYYSGFEELGIYSVAVNFAGVAIILQSVFSTVWSPMVYKWIADGDEVVNITYWMVAIVGLFFSLAGLFSWIIPLVLPPEFSDVQYIFIACLGYPLFYTLSETTVVGINVTKKTNYAMIAGMISLLINILCNYILVPMYGSKGAAISTAISFWVFFVCRTEFSNRVWYKIRNRNIYYLITFSYLLSIIYYAFCGGDDFVMDIGLFLSILVLSATMLYKRYKRIQVSD